MNIEILLDSIILAFLSVSLLLCIGLLIKIFIYLRSFTSNVLILLTFNTYLALFLTCIMMLIIYIYNLYGDLNPSISVNDSWCQLRTYFVNVCLCALYYSCVLQSIFRIFRVVFYKSKILQSYLFFINAIILQWLLSFVLILVNFINGDYQYLPLQYRCWISFENIRGLLLAAMIIYICPLLLIVFIYIYIIRYVRRTNQMHQRQNKSIERDILVLKRITIFVLLIISIGLPSLFILFISIISGKLIPTAYHIQGLSMAIGVFTATISFAFITPQIQQMFNQNQQHVYSSMPIRSYQQTSQQETEGSV